ISRSPKKPGVAAPSNLDDICVAGITPFTTIDFPGRLAGVFYLQGCPWRCRYCYNSEFWPLPPAGMRVPLEKILHFLTARKGHLDGIVFSGGEPTVHERLPVWMKVVRDMGFEIGLHTGGMVPGHLGEVLPLCDWVGMDIKAPFSLYEKVTQIKGSGEMARQSTALVLASGVDYEFRTTVHPSLLQESEILELARELSVMGCKNYVLQMFHSEHCSDKELRESDVPVAGVSANLRQTLKSLFPSFHVRE
ncbi:MAG: anaerobic ribonucleoside-triphosphate reductase activating protein, partial [Candidatus Omnitrophota bacterium]